MTMIYVASYAIHDELEAEREDPSVRDDSLHDFARPRFSAVFNNFGGYELSLLFDAVKEEVVDFYDGELPLGDRDLLLVGDGVFKRLHESSPREEAAWTVERGGEVEVEAVIVVQKVPMGM